MRKDTIQLKDKKIAKCEIFERSDFFKLQKIFFQWLALNKLTKDLHGRKINVPDILSEGIFCMSYDAVRTNNSAYSYDAVLRKTKNGIQIKSACIKNDLTSFGPKSKWDKLYFIDFSYKGIKDGLLAFYNIPSKFIYKTICNHKKHETFIDQQKQGRRPRLSIRKIIDDHGLKPEKIVNISTGKGIIKK